MREHINYDRFLQAEKKKNMPINWQVIETPHLFQRDFKLLELSEPDWCVYHAKVATRFMCGAGSNVNLQRAKKGERKSIQQQSFEQVKGANKT